MIMKIEFEGVRGKGHRGDIALDNITLSRGVCETSSTNSSGNLAK